MLSPVISSDGNGLLLAGEDTILIKRVNRDIFFETTEDTCRLARSIQDMMKAIGESTFLRVNQDIIVNMAHVTGYDAKTFHLYIHTAGKEHIESVYVSRDNRAKVRRYLLFRGFR